MLERPPPAAIEAVELCGRLPLALGIAGGIIEELADSWEDDLLPLLKDEFAGDGAEAIEERVMYDDVNEAFWNRRVVQVRGWQRRTGARRRWQLWWNCWSA